MQGSNPHPQTYSSTQAGTYLDHAAMCYIRYRKKNITLHAAHARVTQEGLTQTWTSRYLKPVPARGLQELWRAVKF